MKPYVQAKLSCDDKTLFTQCACHVFADELAKKLSPKGFVLSRLSDLNRTASQMQALHVFLSKEGKMVDFDGIQNVEEFLESSRQHRLDHDGPIPNFKVLDCSRDDLFKPVSMPGDEERGARNKWHYLINDEFIAECRRRAHARLAATPQLYGLG